MEVSWNRVASKSSILMGFPLMNDPFGGTSIYGTPQDEEPENHWTSIVCFNESSAPRVGWVRHKLHKPTRFFWKYGICHSECAAVEKELEDVEVRNPSLCIASSTSSGWWFGTFFIFPYIGNFHPNWLIFFRGVQTTNQSSFTIIRCSVLFLHHPPNHTAT